MPPDLGGQWERCLAGAPEHQQLFSHSWYSAWFEHIAAGGSWTGECRVLLAHDEKQRLVGILPLAGRRLHVFRVWMLAGPYEPVRGFVCQAHATHEVSRAFARALVGMQRWRDIVRLAPIDVSWPENESLLQALKLETECGFTMAIEANICARDVPTTELDFQAQVRRNSDLKRSLSRQRKLEQEGNFRVVKYKNPLGKELSRALRDCGTVESNSWLARDPEGRMRFNGRRQFQFWERVCSEHLSRRDQLDIWVAYLDEKPIAFDFVVTTNTIRYLIAGQYDESHRKLGLGWMLYGSYAHEGIERGVRIVEMGTGEPGYKARMGGQPENVRRSLTLMPPGPVGNLAARLLNNERVRRFLTSPSMRKLARRALGGLGPGSRARFLGARRKSSPNEGE